jgi:dTDP-4-amino-4,6-dideoxygalactose transaminase
MSDVNTLALLGGTPVRPQPRPIYNTIGEAEKAAVMAVLDSGELSGFVGRAGPYFGGGREVKAFEAAISNYFGVKHAIGVNSATSALHAATHALCLEPGDEVIVSPYTMTATATAILFAGGVPIFADIEDETYGLDPASVEARITPRTRAIMAVNIFGHPCRLAPLREIADRHGLKLIEDNAQSPGAMYRNRLAGTIGHAGILSFNRHKTMQSGEGGVLITDDDAIALRSALLRNHGEVCVEDLNVTDIENTAGLNLRITEMEAAVGRVQFGRIDELTAPRVRLAERLSRNLSRIEGLTPPKVEPDCTHVYYLHCTRMDASILGISRDAVAAALTAEGFPTRAGYLRPIYREPLYKRRVFLGRGGFPFSAHPAPETLNYDEGVCPVCERVQDAELLMTDMIHPPLTEADMDAYADAYAKVLRNRDALRNWSAKQAA